MVDHECKQGDDYFYQFFKTFEDAGYNDAIVKERIITLERFEALKCGFCDLATAISLAFDISWFFNIDTIITMKALGCANDGYLKYIRSTNEQNRQSA